MNSIPSQFDGTILAARYAFMPNKLRYCGGDKNSDIFDYVTQDSSDGGLNELLKEFATMYPYLRLIAESSGIINPFDYRVVEAYWLGNDLLNNVDMKNFYRYMIDEQKLKKSFKPKLLDKVFGKIPLGAKPHHSWHVLNIPKRTGHYPVEHTLETMDKCRISWGKIKEIKSDSGDLTTKAIVEYEPLVIKENRLVLGDLIDKEVWLGWDKKTFINTAKPGDLVSIHWDWVCDYLTAGQFNNLKKWTQYNLNLSNL
ncbi:MAG: DUF6390 family protein [Candidatus Buchananbacteria bacterium]|nr:DUF6390 family protein [Candidatus Buchananbacteria bacterium]